MKTKRNFNSKENAPKGTTVFNPLSKDELNNIFGGRWERRIINGKEVFIYVVK